MATEASPTVRKLRLGIELRKLRVRSGHSMLDAADLVARTDSTISRLETGQVAVSHRVLEKLLDLYEATPEERERLRVLAKQARQRGWWHTYGDVIPEDFDVYLGLETEATRHWIYESEIVTGLLQTEAYARAMLKAEPISVPTEEIEARTALRMRRQELLLADHAPDLSVIVHEGVLHHQVGGIRVMGEQLQHLAALSVRGSVTLQVLPFSAGAHPAMHVGGFTVLSIPLGDESSYDITYVEHRTGCLYMDKAREVDQHKLVFNHLQAKALDHESSRALIHDVAQKMTFE